MKQSYMGGGAGGEGQQGLCNPCCCTLFVIYNFSINLHTFNSSFSCMENLYMLAFLFFSLFFIIVQVQLSLFSLHPSHPHLTPLWLCPCVLYTDFLTTLLLFPPVISFPLPSGYSHIVLNFNVSGYILFACLFS